MVSDDKNRVFLLRAKTRDDYINAVFVDVSFSVYNANPASVSTFMAAQFKITIMYLVTSSATCLFMLVKFMEKVVFQSFKNKYGMMATQMPLPDTQEDLWRLLYDRSSKTVIMLNELDTADEVSVRSRSHNKIIVSIVFSRYVYMYMYSNV